MAAPKSGEQVATVLIPGQQNPAGIYADHTHVYWTLDRRDGAILRASISGHDVTWLATGQDHPQVVAVLDGAIYWANFGSGDASGSVVRLAK